MTSADKGRRPGISVIIPTTCEQRREGWLVRAIDSVLSQRGVDLEVLIVVNGPRVSEPLFERLNDDSRLTLTRLETGSLPAAQQHGRELVSRQYFTLLDDDDELLPDALQDRAELLERDPAMHFVASNGYMTYDGVTDELFVQDFEFARADPLRALMDINWLVSCGALFRSSTIGPDLFEGLAKYHEWTLLAVRMLLAGKKPAFLDKPTFRKHEEIANSLSKSTEYRESSITFLKDLETLGFPRHVEKCLANKIGRALHARAEDCRRQCRLAAAWRYHLQSMRYAGPWRYLLYTRKLLVPPGGAVPGGRS